MAAPATLAAVLWALTATATDTPWVATPPGPTVGDTVWLTRVVAVAPDERLRAAPFEAEEDASPLGDPAVTPAPGGDTVRYALVVWTAGPHHFVLPTLWLLGSGGRSDSLPGGTADIEVRSVLPPEGTGAAPVPKVLLPPVDPRPPAPWIPLLAAVLSLGGLVAAVRLRRRGPRPMPGAAAFVTAAPPPDERWLAAGEPKAVAARASRALRQALARVVPDAGEALPVREALAAAEGRVPGATFRRIRDDLLTLDQVSYAVAHGADVGRVAADARELARTLEP